MLSRIKQPIFLEPSLLLKYHFPFALSTLAGEEGGQAILVEPILEQQNAMYETNTLEILFRIKSMPVEGKRG